MTMHKWGGPDGLNRVKSFSRRRGQSWPGTAPMIKRAGIYLFAALALALGCATAADLYWHDRLMVFDPRRLGSVAVIGLALLRLRISSFRGRTQDLLGRAEQLTRVTVELEASNARLQDSEA